mmetsp:Transcript_18387/g.42417  ORF Transcript_18387/g.42417 Transcript_18387/m.42417 type:complete len:393 (+) Transcript_18387:1064-2242(+)
MVLQVLADVRVVVNDGDAVILQVLGRADSAAHEKLRRRDRPARHDDLASLLQFRVERLHRVIAHQIVRDSRRRPSIEIDSANHGARSHLAVLSFHCLREEGVGSGATLSVDLGDLEAADTILRFRPVVEIVVRSEPGFHADFEEPFAQWILISDIVHHPLSVRSVEFRGSTRHVLLARLEEGQDVDGLPTGYAPVVVILSRSAVVKADVRAGGTAEDLSALQEYVAAVARLFAAGFVLPIVFVVPKEAEDARGDADDHRIVVGGAGLQNQDLLPVRGQPIGQEATRQTATRDDVIVAVLHGVRFQSMSTIYVGNRWCTRSRRCRSKRSGIQQSDYLEELNFHFERCTLVKMVTLLERELYSLFLSISISDFQRKVVGIQKRTSTETVFFGYF